MSAPLHPIAGAPSRRAARAVPFTDRLLALHRRSGWRGFHALWKLRSRGDPHAGILHRARYGALFSLRPYSEVDAFVLRCGYYESEVLEALRPWFRPDAVFWDVGANFGLHAVTAGRLEPAMTVIAFEPNPREAQRIRDHAGLNGTTVTVAELALGGQGGERDFHVARGNTGMSTLYRWDRADYEQTFKVAVERADSLVAAGRFPAPTVMKIDVEGAEPEVIAGLGSLLGSPALEAIVFEAEPGLERLNTPHALVSPLHAAGFALRRLVRREPTHHALENYVASRGAAPC